MQLQESGEMYLESIYVLSQKGSRVRAIDVGEHMGYSKPSVSRALGILRQNGLLLTDKDGFLTLTEQGERIARQTYERHTVLTELFVRLGVSPEVAAADACKIEHDISEETFLAIQRHAAEFGQK